MVRFTNVLPAWNLDQGAPKRSAPQQAPRSRGCYNGRMHAVPAAARRTTMEELIDIYDANHQLTGLTAPRRGLFLKEGQYMLYVLAIIQDPQGRILITQRSHAKHWGAGWWEVSGGGVLSGETSRQAVIREVGEEVGLDVSGREPELVYSYENVDLDRGDNYLVDIYRFQLDVTAQDVTLQEEEAVDAQMATWDQITALKEQGIFLHYDRIRLALEACGQL